LFSIEDDFENISRLAKMNIANRAIFYLSGFAILAISKMKLEKIFIENKMYKISSSKDELQIMPYKNYSLVISKYPLMLFDKKPYLSKLGVNNFLIDLSFIPPNKNYLKTVLDAFNGTLNIKSDFGGNFLRGLK
ncbi:MAG: hypothetical protein LBC07_06515, partial [Elusimicrobiota bacterium]|nr:hypothetical protein [Elusimicrobiota bacterium]